MARPQKLRNPRAIVAHVEAEIKDEWNKLWGRLSWGEFFTSWYLRQKNMINAAVKIEALERENLELKKRNEELEKLVEKLESQLRLVKGTPKEEREFEELKSKVEKIFAEENSMKMLDFLRKLGYSGSSEKLIKQAKKLIEEHFKQVGTHFVSKKLGLRIIPQEGFAELAWIVEKMKKGVKK